VLEAKASGCFVISTDVGVANEAADYITERDAHSIAHYIAECANKFSYSSKPNTKELPEHCLWSKRAEAWRLALREAASI
jgi:hypothetical protein